MKKSLAQTHPEIAAQWHPTKNGDLTPADVTAGSHKCVWWKCDRGLDHEWKSPIERRIVSPFCSICTGKTVVLSNCLATTHPEIASQWHPTKNGDLTPYDIIAGSNKKIWWKCSVGSDHEWITAGNHRVRGSGCSVCAGKRVVLSNCLATTHPEIAAQWHSTKNGSITPYDVTAGSNKKFWWKCDKEPDHEWETHVHCRSNGHSCPCCIGQKVVPSNCLATTHPEVAAQWHPTKNGKLTPYNVTFGSTINVWWKCDKGPDHEWESTVDNRNGQGCSVCAGKTVVLSNCLATTHPEVAAQWHPTKNGKLTPFDITAGSSRTGKVWWKCDKGPDHEWESLISNRGKGSTCPCCINQKAVLSNCLATTHPEIAKQWHPTKNGSLTSYDVTAGSDKRIWWVCDKRQDHEWNTVVGCRLSGTDCPICRASRGEKAIADYLIKCNMVFKREYRFKKASIGKCRFDFAVSSTWKGLIEFHGEQHYFPVSFGAKSKEKIFKSFVTGIRRDSKKEQWCKDHKIPLLTIPYWDKNRIEEILADVFDGKQPCISEPPVIVKKYEEIRSRIARSK